MAEEDAWGFGDGDDDAPAEKTPAAAAEAPAAAAEPAAPAPAASEAAAPAAVEEKREEAEHPAPGDDKYRKPLQLYKHWVRPKFLQYNYMYNYRTNYYDDVIDYLDKRNRGYNREIPRPQTWAERVLRTNQSYHSESKFEKKEDHHLIQTIASSIKTHNYHTKAYINRKYSSVL